MASTEARKRAPPEKPEAVSLRTKIVFSFWAIILCLGLPVWYQTTSIYRATLPLQEMLDWADSAKTLPPTPLQVWVHSQSPCSEAERLIRDTQSALDDLNEFPLLHPRLRIVHDAGESPCGDKTTNLHPAEAALELHLSEPQASFSLDFVPGKASAQIHPSSATPQSLPTDLAKALITLFAYESIAQAHQIKLYATTNHNAHNVLLQQPRELVADIEKQLARAAKFSPSYHLTFSLFTATGVPSSWDIQELLDTHIHPLTRALKSTANINVATQIQLYSSYSPSIQPYRTPDQEGTFLRSNDLTAFVNAAEWPLSPSIGSGPTLNFIIYVPSPSDLPLRIEHSNAQSWLIPQWGGIYIVNPPLTKIPGTEFTPSIPPRLSSSLLTPAFQSFSTQLLSLLGVPILTHNNTTTSLPLPLRLQTHQRLSSLTLRFKAASSLGSLARLSLHLSSIPIPLHVAQLVDNAMRNLTASVTAFGESRWDDSVRYASLAYEDSEKAFFDKSMVGQVYFPDEHRVAVYMPLLGPIAVPLVVGLVRELRGLAARVKGKKS